MKIFLNIVLITCCCFFSGCGTGSNVTKDSLEGVKITDIEPAYGQRKMPDKLIAKLVVHRIRVDANDYSGISDNIWDNLFTDKLVFEDKNSFDENGFKAGFGKGVMWNQIRDVLQTVGTEKSKTIAITIEDGWFDDIYVNSLAGRTELFYLDREGSFSGHRLDPGKVIFRLSVKKVPQSTSFIDLKITPAYIPLAGLPQTNAVKFGLVSFGTYLDEKEFILIGPDKFRAGNNTLKGLFFSQSIRKNYVNLYLIACVKIID